MTPEEGAGLMQRVLVIGCPGSGKSTFSRRLRDATGLPLCHLDLLWHRADKTTCSREEFDRKLGEVLARERWIIDGNYLRTMRPRLERCDTVFFFDLPVRDCLAGVEARIGKPREDMPWVEQEFDPEFRQFILDFPRDRVPVIYALLEEYREGRTVVTFPSRKAADQWLANREKVSLL